MHRLPAAALLAWALALPAPAQEDVRLVTLRSPAYQGERKVIIGTPPRYAQDTARRYPVLYFTDGGPTLDPLRAAVRFLEARGRMPEVILVGILQEDRTRELTPSHVRDRETSGGAGVLLRFLEMELVPFVEKTYRTAPLRILLGHSLGGLFSLHVLEERPGLFRAHVALSPSLGWDGDLPLRRAAELVAREPGLQATVIVAQGDEGPELAGRIERLAAILAPARGVTFQALRFPGEDHGSVVFPAQYQGLQAVFSGWRMPVAEGDVGPRGGLAAVDAHYARLSARLGWEVPPPEPMANLAAYQVLRQGDREAALRAFHAIVERHPGSANAHDSLGEAYERTDDLASARREYGIAVEMAARSKDPNLPAFQRNLARVSAREQVRQLEEGAGR
jgi:predicted alpha/beta superfamily hydrolase